MYHDADLHIATKRLLLNYQDSTEKQGIFIKEVSGNASETINASYAQGPRWSPDGRQFAYFGNGQIYIHSAMDAEPVRVVELPDYYAGFCEWSPTGEALIFSAYSATAKSRPPNIYRYNFDNEAITQITDNADVDRFPQWNHMGSHIACQRTYRDPAGNHTGIVIVNLNTHREQVLPKPPGFSQRISRDCWSPDDAQLIVSEYRDDMARLVVIDIASGEVVWMSTDTRLVGGCFEPQTGRVVSVTNDALSIHEWPSQALYAQLHFVELAPVRSTLCGPVLFFDTDEETVYFLGNDARFYRWRIHHTCEAIIAPEIGKREMPYQRQDYTFRASDGYDIPVQRYLPPSPNGRAIVFVQGGPSEPIDPDNAIVARLLAEGYEVLRPAYRGCGGYGDDHRQANRHECGRADVRDVVECGIDWQQRLAKPDAPLAVAGFSYGGYLTFLAMTHPDAPWTCGITFWGCTKIPPLVQTTGLPADPQARHTALAARSPVRQAHRIRFPLLILHGDRDTGALTAEVKLIHERVSASHIPCQMVVFENEGHGLRGCRAQVYAETLKFLEMNSGKAHSHSPPL